MIIETGFRQTGKSTRMFQHALKHLLDNENSTICCISSTLDCAKYIKNKIIELFTNNSTFDNSNHYENNNHWRERKYLARRIKYSVSMNNGEDFSHYYVDNFGFVKNDKIKILDNAYYVCLSKEGYRDYSKLLGKSFVWDIWFELCLELCDTNKNILYKYSDKFTLRKIKIHNFLNKDNNIGLYDHIMMNETVTNKADKSKLYQY